MTAANPGWLAAAATAPDGDADIDGAVIESFAAPRFEECGGQLKPETVPPDRRRYVIDRPF